MPQGTWKPVAGRRGRCVRIALRPQKPTRSTPGPTAQNSYANASTNVAAAERNSRSPSVRYSKIRAFPCANGCWRLISCASRPRALPLRNCSGSSGSNRIARLYLCVTGSSGRPSSRHSRANSKRCAGKKSGRKNASEVGFKSRHGTHRQPNPYSARHEHCHFAPAPREANVEDAPPRRTPAEIGLGGSGSRRRRSKARSRRARAPYTSGQLKPLQCRK